ncbi:hypothetical protein PF010_g16928 [Phytophthora fragariae]|uniref:Uncharacterized protein n=1 Tax=Phytophthora fragariae TaxID=53985 RepID=A0A6A4DDN5_9STRA|nr:hypothetical protein PF007_g17690 [Phytophthora fragariae]KAE9094880.1 hypothetical protein PF010_g16928 [Phytophthora fragariae]KAE9306579.1 hypothetical protein PF001_g12055 [Phytophthora fragariae]
MYLSRVGTVVTVSGTVLTVLVTRQSTCELLFEEQLVEDELTVQSSDFSED